MCLTKKYEYIILVICYLVRKFRLLVGTFTFEIHTQYANYCFKAKLLVSQLCGQNILPMIWAKKKHAICFLAKTKLTTDLGKNNTFVIPSLHTHTKAQTIILDFKQICFHPFQTLIPSFLMAQILMIINEHPTLS